MMNYAKEAKAILQEYMDKNHVLFRDQKEAEYLVQIAFMKGYGKGLDYGMTSAMKNIINEMGKGNRT